MVLFDKPLGMAAPIKIASTKNTKVIRTRYKRAIGRQQIDQGIWASICSTDQRARRLSVAPTSVQSSMI